MTNELKHHGVKGMKWGVRRNRLTSAASQRIKKEVEKRNERFKDDLASRDPISKQRREQAKERQKRRDEMLEISQAKGKAKAVKILKKNRQRFIKPRNCGRTIGFQASTVG